MSDLCQKKNKVNITSLAEIMRSDVNEWPVSNKQGECVLGTNTEVFLWLPHAYILKECMCTHRHKCIRIHVRRITDTHTHRHTYGVVVGGERKEREWKKNHKE